MIQSNISSSPLQGPSPAAPAPDVSVIIVSWNVRDLLAQCLTALLDGNALGGLSAEVIVVDNASADGSVERAALFPGVQVVKSNRNLGYGRANNIGLRMARGKHLLVLNPDTMPRRGSVERLVLFQRACPRAGIASPRLLNSDGTVQAAAFSFPTLPMAAIDLFPLPNFVPGRLRQRLYGSRLNGRYPDEGRREVPFKINHPLGACMMLSREAYTHVGGFDSTIFMYAEEIDLAIRYARAGWECWQVPQAEVIHVGGQSTAQAPTKMYLHLWRSRLYLYKRHYPILERFALIALLLASQVMNVAASLLRLIMRRTQLENVKRKLERAGKVARMVLRG